MLNTYSLAIIVSVVFVLYAFSFVKYKRERDRRKSDVRRPQQLPMIYLILLGPLYFFLLNRNSRQERRAFMKGKRRYS